jgi:hypothetical protein
MRAASTEHARTGVTWVKLRLGLDAGKIHGWVTTVSDHPAIGVDAIGFALRPFIFHSPVPMMKLPVENHWHDRSLGAQSISKECCLP